MRKSQIPKDSILHHWIKTLSVTEVPTSYQISVGISTIGALLKRNIYIDQHSSPDDGWNVYPNQSVMLVGPSGIGKDTCINYAIKTIRKHKLPGDKPLIPIIGGRTMESFYQQLYSLKTDPACGYVPAKELSSFFGSRDYQSGMVQDMTDLLSSPDEKDISTKGDLAFLGTPKIIPAPTLTMHAGTTEEWLHKAMPDGTMEGGFLGRFLIIVEQFGGKHVPLIKDLTKQELLDQSIASDSWQYGLMDIIANCTSVGEMTLLIEAKDLYTNWYWNRFQRFSKSVLPYANRSRDTVLRLAMLMAVSRMHFNWIEDIDIQFGIDMLDFVSKGITEALLPPTIEAQAAKEILKLCPTTWKTVLQTLGRKFKVRDLESGKVLLMGQGAIKMVEGDRYVKVPGV